MLFVPYVPFVALFVAAFLFVARRAKCEYVTHIENPACGCAGPRAVIFPVYDGRERRSAGK